MADSCRPVSRHGRYNSSGPSSMQYAGDVTAYGTMSYSPTDEMYTVSQPERPERPRTSRGHRRPREAPARPVSRHSRKEVPDDEESFGRPVSRVGFSPESSYRYSHDEYSRQVSSDNERQIQNSPCDSQEILYRDDEYFNNQKALYGSSPKDQQSNVDRLIVSPTGPQDILGTHPAQKPRKSPRGSSRKSPYSYGQSPKSHTQSPQGYRESPHGYRDSPQNYRSNSQHETYLNRPSSREYVNVSPLQRDEAQLEFKDLHHHDTTDHFSRGSPYQHEGEAYQQRFAENTSIRNSPYRDSPYQHRDSPYNTAESPYYGSSPSNRGYGPGTPESHSKPPRPKSARPKTGRKKSARVRQRQVYQDQETSLPQQCDTASILNAGDPYGRPSSSLSPYKPLPAIGVTTPRDPIPLDQDHGTTQSFSKGIDNMSDSMSIQTQKLSLSDSSSFHPADENTDIFTAEDIQGAEHENLTPYTGYGVPDIGELHTVRQHFSDEILQSSIADYEHNIGQTTSVLENVSEKQANTTNNSPSSVPKPLAFLHEIPDEPTESEQRLLLAIKLPDGRRLQRFFSPSNPLETVMHFAENSSLASYEDYQLICNAPRTSFTDLSIRISDAQIKDRTVLYLEEKE